jgi:hypothetical protein
MTAKIRPKSGQHATIPRNYAIVSGLIALYPSLSAIFHHSKPDRAADIDQQEDRVRGARPGAGVGHARQHIGGSTCVCRLFAECSIVTCFRFVAIVQSGVARILDVQKARLVEMMRNGAV